LELRLKPRDLHLDSFAQTNIPRSVVVSLSQSKQRSFEDYPQSV